MATDEMGKFGGTILSIFLIVMTAIAMAFLALVAIKAMASSPWAVFSIGMTIPIALIMGCYQRFLRPGRVIETTLLGFVLLVLDIVAGGWIASIPAVAAVFTLDAKQLVIALVIYSFAAAALPHWLLVTPRDYLSTLMKIGTLVLLVIGIIIANPEFEDVRSLEGVAPTQKPCVPIIAVPTTAGTAAEVTINYVITDVERKRKFVCVDPHDMPIIAIVDPDMMSSMPKGLTASTGMDALTHAIEGYTTKAAWEMTDMFHLKAIEIISKSLRNAVANTKEGREGMALGQYIAGMGFSNVGLGIAHSMAHTLGAVYDTPHGVACAMMLPIVMEYNADCTGEKYREIARAMGVEGVDQMDQAAYRKAAVDAVRKLSEDVGIPSKLEAIKEEDLPFLAESAHADACAPGNPKDASIEDLTALFRKLM